MSHDIPSYYDILENHEKIMVSNLDPPPPISAALDVLHHACTMFLDAFGGYSVYLAEAATLRARVYNSSAVQFQVMQYIQHNGNGRGSG